MKWTNKLEVPFPHFKTVYIFLLPIKSLSRFTANGLYYPFETR